MASFRLPPVAVVAVPVAVLALLTASCGVGDRGSAVAARTDAGATGSPRAAAPPSPSPSSSGTTLSPEAEVEAVVLRAGDVPGLGQPQLIEGGDQVAGQVTLNECGFRFPSEELRVARRQVSIGPRAAGFSNEVVAYDSVASARQALGEIESVVGVCHHRKAPDVEGEAIWTLVGAADPAHVPAQPSFLTSGRVRGLGGRKTFYLLMVFQQSGNVLDCNYYGGTQPPTRAQTVLFYRQVQVTGQRLVALAAPTA